MFSFAAFSGHAGGVVTTATESALRASLAGGGTVTFSCSGTITLTSEIVIGQNTIIDGTGHDIVLSGNDAVRVLSINTNISLNLINLTIAHGRAVGPDGVFTPGIGGTPGQNGCGGGINNHGGLVTTLNCVFQENAAIGGNGGVSYISMWPAGNGGRGQGASIYSAGGQVTCSNSTFICNQVFGGKGGTNESSDISKSHGNGGDGEGGAIFAANGTVTIYGCSFATNQVSPGSALVLRYSGHWGTSYGGAIAASNAVVAVFDSRLTGNSALEGFSAADINPSLVNGYAYAGAICLLSGSLDIMDCVFTQNSVRPGIGAEHGSFGLGGAIYVSSGAARLTNSAFSANQAVGAASVTPSVGLSYYPGGSGKGGAIASEGTLTAQNCTFVDNTAQGGIGFSTGGDALGGAISGSATLTHVTLSGNRAIAGNHEQTGAGAFPGTNRGDALCGNFTLRNCIVASSVPGTNCVGTIIDDGNNISSDSSANFTRSASLNNTAPMLGAFGDHGGPTPTVALLFGSPAIDRANQAYALPTDQRGVTRPQGVAADIGAFEYENSTTGQIAVDGEIPSSKVTRNGQAVISFYNPFASGVAFYTSDGSSPSLLSTLYDGPFTIHDSATIRAVFYSPDLSQSSLAGPQEVEIVPFFILTLTQQPNGTVTATPPIGPYLSNTVVRLVASPANGYFFAGWGGDAAGSSLTNDITMNRSKAIWPIFTPTPKYDLSFSVHGRGTVSVIPGKGPYASNTLVTLVAHPVPPALFLGWSGDVTGSGLTNTIIMNGNRSVKADFGEIVSFAATTLGGGSIDISPSQQLYAQYSTNTITAVASDGWKFIQWLGDAAGTNPTISLTLERSKKVRAIFGTQLVTSTVGSGSVIADPALSFYPYGSTVKLSAVPQPGNCFAAWWSSDLSGTNTPATLVITKPTPNVSALFSALTNAYVLSVTPKGAGNVAFSPQARFYSPGQVVTVTALPEAGQKFQGWSGDATGNTNVMTLTMSRNWVVDANFSHRPSLQVRGQPEGLQMELTGTIGATYDILSSPDLKNWQWTATVTNLFGVAQFNASPAPSTPKLFYQVMESQ